MKKRNVAVLGVGQTKFGSHPDKSLADLFADAFKEAFEESNIEKKDIEALYYGNFNGELTDGSANMGGFLTDEVGLGMIPAYRYEAACASSQVAFREATRAVAAGYHDIVVVGGSERLHSAGTALGTRALATSVEGIHEITTGLGFPGVFGLAARLYAKEYNISIENLREKMAHVSIKNHKFGARNPKAQFYQKMGDLDVETVLSGRMISSPLSLYDCCPMTDGGSAAIVTTDKIAEDLINKPVYVLGTGQASGGALFRQGADMVKAEPRRKSSQMAYKEAGIKPDDVDVVEIHDCFTIAEIIATEALGIFDYGKGADAAEQGETDLGGKVVVNPDGGLIGKGHPVGATGTSQIYALTRILRDEFKSTSVKGAEIGLTDTLGGDFGTLCNVLLGRGR